MPTLSEVARDAAVDAVTALLDGGTLDLYADPAAAPLVTLDLSPEAFGPSVGGEAEANVLASGVARGAGELVLGRWCRRDGSGVLDVTVGPPGSGADLELSDTVVAAGATVSVTSFTLTFPV